MKKQFMDADFLLESETAKHLYHTYAAPAPIIDYHCHIIPEQIAKDIQFENITRIWLGGDHYKWRLLRANGVEERYITGNAPDRDKFRKWTETLENAFGNPIYHWSHLELQRFFGFHGTLGRNTADEVWELANARLASKDYSARGLMRASNVKLICTTDDPADTLEWHRRIEETKKPGDAVVYPAFRPDKAFQIEKPDYLPYLEKLAEAADTEINSFHSLTDALAKRILFFKEHGCRAADHGLDYVPFARVTPEEANRILQKRLSGKDVTPEESLQFKTGVLLFLAEKYHESGWVMQLHFSCKRNNNTRMFNLIGPDTGYDSISTDTSVVQLSAFLDTLESQGTLPKTILYSLNPADNALLAALMGCFQGDGYFGKMQHGSAWWFNDHKAGMRDQMISLANSGLFGSFVGMLTDSRSFLSYPRHEYFRRILCDLLGGWVENGECPDDEELLAAYIKNISYNNAASYFDLPLERI